MPIQTHVTEVLRETIAKELAQIRSAEQRDHEINVALDNERVANALDKVNNDRVHDKVQSVQKNEVMRDHVHISPEAQALYRAKEAGVSHVSEKIHNYIRPDEEIEGNP
jgi:GTP-binding protein EngB required for normal cell division